MKNFKKSKIISQVFFIILLLFLNNKVNAQTGGPSVSFSGNPTIEMQNENGQIGGYVSGGLSYTGGATSQNTEIRIICSPNVISGPGDYPSNNYFETYLTDSNGIMPTPQFNSFYYSFSNQGFFVPGQTFYCLFEIFYGTNSNPINSSVISFLVPGNNQSGGNQDTQGQVDDSSGGTTEGWSTGVIQNPLSVSDINSFIVGLLNAVLKIGIPIMVIFLVYSGLKLVMARGNEKELEEAKKNLLWVIIGVAICLSAWTIVKILKGTFDQIDLSYLDIINSYFL